MHLTRPRQPGRRPVASSARVAVLLTSLLAQQAGAATPHHGDEPARRPRVLFGHAVAFAGPDLLIGRPGTSARSHARYGGVHLFRRDASGSWSEAAVIAPKDLASGDEFGAALVVDRDRLAVGAPGANGGRGAIYLFERDASGAWIERAKLVVTDSARGIDVWIGPKGAGLASTAGGGARLGSVVALAGDLLVAGQPDVANGHGRAVVFRWNPDGEWRQRAVLLPPDSVRRRFGQAIAVVGDRLFIGAPGNPSTSGINGMVAIVRDSGGAFVEEQRLAVDGDAVVGFGGALLADGASVWVGSAFGSASASGAVHQFRRDRDGRWGTVASLAAPQVNGQFGAGLARSGRDLLIGMPEGDELAGAISVFRDDSAPGRWTVAQHLKLPGAVPHMRGGRFFATTEDLLAVGLELVDGGEGGVAVFHRDPSTRQWKASGTLVDSAWNMARDAIRGGSVPCADGRVTVFDCYGVEVLSFLPLSDIGGGTLGSQVGGNGWGDLLSDAWGWTDSVTGRELVLVNRQTGTAFVEVTDPVNPRYLGNLPLPFDKAWRSVRVYKDHAFIAGPGGGIQVVDLTQYRDAKLGPITVVAAARYDGLAAARSLAVDPEAGILYAAGAAGGEESCNDGLHMIDARTPLTPRLAGCYRDSLAGAMYDATCVRYRGVDSRYRGREICAVAARAALVIADVTDNAAPRTISRIAYPALFADLHGAFHDGQRYFYLGDARHEVVARAQTGTSVPTRTMIFDLADLDRPVRLKDYSASTTVADRRQFVRGRYLYQANTLAGLRVLDLADPARPVEVGYLDTTPAGQNRIGAFTVYPFLKNDVAAVPSADEGLFLVRLRR